MTEKKLEIEYTGDVSGVQAAQRQMDSLHQGFEDRLKKTGASIASVGKKMTLGLTLPIAAAGFAMIHLASDAAETENKVHEVFGSMAGDIIEWSDTSIERMGLAQAGAQDMLSTFGLLFKSAGFGADEVVNLSETFAQLAGDAASFFNVPFDVAFEKLRSGLTGEAEPMRDFGVFLSEAAVQAKGLEMGLGGTTGALTEQEKVMARSQLIIEGMSTATGDYSRTADSMANRTRAAKERFKELGADLGTLLIPVAEKVVGLAQGLADWFSHLDDGTKKWILTLAGIAAVTGPGLVILGKLAGAVGNLRGVFGKAGSAKDKFSKNITGTLVPSILTGVVATRSLGAAVFYALGVMHEGQDGHKAYARSAELNAETVKNLAGNVRSGSMDMASMTATLEAMNEASAKAGTELINVDDVLALIPEHAGEGAQFVKAARDQFVALGGAVDETAAAADAAAPALDAAGVAVGDLGAQTTDAAAATQDLHLAELSLAGGLLGVEGAALSAAGAEADLKAARADLAKLTRDGKKGTDDYRDAVTRVRSAQLDAIESQLGLENAVAGYLKELEGGTVTQKQAIAQIKQAGREAGLSKEEIQALIDRVRGYINSLDEVPGFVRTRVETLYVPKFGEAAHFQHGTEYFSGGVAEVGEAGRELAVFPRGTRVVPHGETEDLLSGRSGGGSAAGPMFVINLNGPLVGSDGMREFAEILRREFLLDGRRNGGRVGLDLPFG